MCHENVRPRRDRGGPDDSDERHENDVDRHGPVDDEPGLRGRWWRQTYPPLELRER